MKIITIFLHRRITMINNNDNNYNWITIYFYIFIFMLNFFLLFVDCILQTIGNDIKSSNYIMYFIKILYHETKVLIINCDEVFVEVLYQNCCNKVLYQNCCNKVLYQNCCDEDVMKYSMKFYIKIVVIKFYIKIVVIKFYIKIVAMKMWWNIRWSSISKLL